MLFAHIVVVTLPPFPGIRIVYVCAHRPYDIEYLDGVVGRTRDELLIVVEKSHTPH